MNALTKLNLGHLARQLIYKLRNRPKIKSKDCIIGKNVIFGRNVVISAKRVRIGDGCSIGNNVLISVESFEMGDYGIIYHNAFFPGGVVKIGHNFWLGKGSIVDGRAGMTIGNNVGIGAQSQLWTHMVYGDVMRGCRFHTEKPMTIGNDVWLVGHNLVSPVNIHDRSMALLGSVITKDMAQDRTYAGTPAADLTDKFGSQFKDISIQDKTEILKKYLTNFATKYGLGNYASFVKIYDNETDAFDHSQMIQFNIATRSYKKTGSILEYHLMKFLLPDIKFIPVN